MDESDYFVANSPSHNRFANIPYVSIEITSYCNRDCPFCPRNLDRTGTRKDADGDAVHTRMPTEKVISLIDQLHLGGYRGEISFHFHSDPFLDKRYTIFAFHAARRGLKVSESTNGDVLKQNLKLCQAIDGIVDPITVGIYDYNTHAEKLKLMDFWNNRFKITKVLFSTPYENLNPRHNSELYAWQVTDERVLDTACQWRKNNLLVRYDGAAMLCCQDDYASFDLGNVFEEGLDHVLFSMKRKQIVETLDEDGGRRNFEFCSKCYCGTVPDYMKSAEEIEHDKLKVEKLDELQKMFEQGAIDLRQLMSMSNDLVATSPFLHRSPRNYFSNLDLLDRHLPPTEPPNARARR